MHQSQTRSQDQYKRYWVNGGPGLWKSTELMVTKTWLVGSIRSGTCLAVTHGSYIKEITNEVCSCEYVLVCTEGWDRLVVSFPKKSKEACVYGGKLMGLLAIHLTLLAANKNDPELQGKVEIVSSTIKDYEFTRE